MNLLDSTFFYFVFLYITLPTPISVAHMMSSLELHELPDILDETAQFTEWYTLGVYLKLSKGELDDIYREEVVQSRIEAMQDRALQSVDEDKP